MHDPTRDFDIRHLPLPGTLQYYVASWFSSLFESLRTVNVHVLRSNT